jgi:hypothetical protein
MIMDHAPIPISSEMRPILLVVVDTEESFDWSAPFDRASTSVAAMDSIGRGQEIFDAYGVRPVYVVDQPIVDCEAGFQHLRRFVADDRAVIGAHLHPWVSPPFSEPVNSHNSYPGNLAPELEEEKLRHLTERIAVVFGESPRIYKAGRYGIGPHTPAILEKLGYEIDLSVAPPFDYRADGGPDFSAIGNDPYWFGPGADLLGLPCTGAFVGSLAGHGHWLHPLVNHPLPQSLRLPGILSRLSLLERIRLTPEGYDLEDLIRLTNHLMGSGSRIFSLSFHSPSLSPGELAYVPDEAGLKSFLQVIDGYLDFFFNRLQGESLTPMAVKERLRGRSLT